MPEPPIVVRVDDPLAGLRAATAAHAAAVDASKRAGADVQAAKQPAAPPAVTTS